MPYIITTKRSHWSGREDITDPFSEERRAVATLEDPPGSMESGVRGLLYAMVPEETTAHEHDDLYEQIDAIGESGGTVGPLPDGTVIQVAPITWHELTSDAGGIPETPASDEERAEVIDAYNANQGQATS